MKKRPRVFSEFKNIRTLPSGYQVAVTRNKREFSKHFAGHSEKALNSARRWRDQMLRLLPNKRKKPIPPRVLAAFHLKKPAVGVFRYPDRQFYCVTYRDRKQAMRSRTFSWPDRDEEIAAYGAAMKFRRRVEKSR